MNPIKALKDTLPSLVALVDSINGHLNAILDENEKQTELLEKQIKLLENIPNNIKPKEDVEERTDTGDREENIVDNN